MPKNSKISIQQKQFYDIVHLIKMSQNNAVMSVNVEMLNLYWNVGQYTNKFITQ